MNKLAKPIAALLLGMVVAYAVHALWPEGSGATENSAARQDERKPLYWVAPMDPSYKRDKPGKSPMGMDLIPVYEEDAAGGGVKIDNVEAHNLAIRTAKVRQGPLVLRLDSVGRVAYDEDLQIHVHTRVSGWLERLYVKADGDWVEKGQLLFSLYSPELVNAQHEYIAALSSGDRILSRASRSRLRYLGLTTSQIDALEKSRKVQDRIDVRAAQAGYVDNIRVGEGEFVTPKTTIMSISSLDSVWVLVDVFERDADLVAEGMSVDITLESFPGESWQGRIAHVYPALNSKSRTLPVRVVVPNPEHRLRPHMLARVSMQRAANDAILVPKEAVIRGRVDRVVKVDDTGHYDVAVIRRGRVNDLYAEVLAGLEPGDTVVTSSQFLIDSESNLDEALKRFEKAQSARQGVLGKGQVQAVDRQARTLTIAHDPIGALGWPAMTMDFGVADDVSIPEGLEGHTIHFRLVKKGDGFLIDQIHLMGSSGDGEQDVKDHSQMDHSQMDHSQMDHSQMDHSQMDHSQMDHSQMDHSQMDHSQMDHSQMDHTQKHQHMEQPEPAEASGPDDSVEAGVARDKGGRS